MAYSIRTIAAGLTLGVAATAANAQVVILESFDVDEGRFAQDPDFSGSNRGLIVSAGAGPSTADRTTVDPERGEGAELLSLDLNNEDAITGFQLRFLAGGGSVTATNPAFAPDGFIGLFVKSADSFEIGFNIDDGTTIEQTPLFPYTGGTGYQLAQFNLDGSDFTRFNGTGGTAALDAATVNIDSIFVRSGVEQDLVTFRIDTVARNPEGNLNSLVPEPTSLALLGLGGLGMLARRRRA